MGKEKGKEQINLIVNKLWNIGKDRNGFQFESKGKKEIEVVQKAWQEWEEYDRCCKEQEPHRSKNENDLKGHREERRKKDHINLRVAVKSKQTNRKVGWESQQ